MPFDRHPEESVRAEAGHLVGIEALRALAVAWVVAFHWMGVRDPAARDPWAAAIDGWPLAAAIVRNGYLGVDLFFLITGFLLVIPWVRHAAEGRPAPGALDFYRRRVLRIVPAYYVHLAALFALFLPLLLGRGFARENAGFVAANLAAHASFLHYTTPLTSASLNLNGALWTLALEAQFYLLLPLLAPAFVRAPALVALALAAVAGAWRWLALNDLEPLVAWQMAIGARWGVPEATIRHLLLTQLPGYFGHFAAGMGLAVLWWRRSRHQDSATAGWLHAALAAAGAALLLWAYALGGGAVLGPVGSWLATIAGLAALLLALAHGGAPLRAIFAHAPILFTGRVSYSIYLWHVPLLLAWNRLRILDGDWASLPAWLAAVLIVAGVSWRFVEAPFLRKARPAPPIIGG